MNCFQKIDWKKGNYPSLKRRSSTYAILFSNPPAFIKECFTISFYFLATPNYFICLFERHVLRFANISRLHVIEVIFQCDLRDDLPPLKLFQPCSSKSSWVSCALFFLVNDSWLSYLCWLSIPNKIKNSFLNFYNDIFWNKKNRQIRNVSN